MNALSVSPDGKRLVSAGEDGHFCFYLTPTFQEGDKEKLIEKYNELPKHDDQYWMTIFMHSEEGNSKCITQTLDNHVKVIDVIKAEVIYDLVIPESINAFCDIALTLDNKTIYTTGSDTKTIVEIDISKMNEEQPPR